MNNNYNDTIENKMYSDYIGKRNAKFNFYITFGLKLINPSCKTSRSEDVKERLWKEFVKENFEYDEVIIKAVLFMLLKTKNGESFYKAEIEVYGDKFSLDGWDAENVDKALRLFTPKKEEYKVYYKKNVIKQNNKKYK